MEYDLHSQMKAEVALDQQTISTATTTAGNVIDTKGFESLEFIVHTGAVTAAGVIVPLIEESDEITFGGEETVVDPTRVLGGFTIDDNADDDKVFRVGSIGKKRFQRLSLVSTGSPNLVAGAIAVLAHAKSSPTDEQAT